MAPRAPQVDVALRSWLEKRRAGQQTQPDPDAKTSCLRPARASTLREKLRGEGEAAALPSG